MVKKRNKEGKKKEIIIVLALAFSLVLLGGISACVCGNEILEEGEQCDDGNIINSDGCSANCTYESFCPLNENDYDEIIIINTKLVSKNLYMDYVFESSLFPVSLSKGNYSITLAARDNFSGRESDYQPNEQYVVSFFDDSSLVATSPPTSDLADYVSFAQVEEIVSDNLYLPNGVNSIKAVHYKFSEIPTSTQNSLTAVCVGIKKISEPPYCGDGIINGNEECDGQEGCLPDCTWEEEECYFDISVRYSYSYSNGTGIAIGYANGTWFEEKPVHLNGDGNYEIKYFLDNNVADTTNDAHVIVKVDENIIYEYDKIINKSTSKSIDLNISGLTCGIVHTVYLDVESEANGICTDDNESDNYAQRQFIINCEEPEPYCGDGNIDLGEECDDGNKVDDDGCSANCNIEVLPYCGDGNIDDGEECDLGTLNGISCTPEYGGICSYCSYKCEEIRLTDGYCGDGVLQWEYEECDDGNTDSDDGCSSICDIEEEEQCEENVSVRKSYSYSYGTGIAIGYANGTWFEEKPAVIGEGIYKLRYFIDNNIINTTNNAHIVVKIDENVISDYAYNIKSFHSKTINLNTSGIVCDILHNVSVQLYSQGEQVCVQDDSSDNYAQRQFIINCEEPEPYCGDGNIDLGEECDDGNKDSDDGCSSECTIEVLPYCGDGNLDLNEECDKGLLNGVQCNPLYDSSCTYCSNLCENITLTDGYCGDSIVQSEYEECEVNLDCNDQNTHTLDSCNGCECYHENIPYCGDGIINGNEECDDGNKVDDDGCSANCNIEVLPYCGDGIINGNEECDKGLLNGVQCNPLYDSSCTYCSNLCDNITLTDGYCGDSIVQSEYEECDDGDSNNLDTCRNNCELPYCGDGIKDAREYCDDGNNVNGDGCSKTCRNECLNGICTPNITTENFVPIIWQCDSRVVYDDATRPGRVSADGNPLIERINNYAFEGEQIKWRVLVMDKNGIEKVGDVFVSVDGNIEANCKKLRGNIMDETCNARILEEQLTEFNPNTMSYYECTLTVETPESMYGQSKITVEAKDLDGEIGEMDEEEVWFLNPTVSLGVEGGLVFSSLRAGTVEYSQPVILSNNAEDGSGVLLDMFISGTNFYDTSSSGAMCPTSNQLSLSAFNYYATDGNSNTDQDARADEEGYVPIQYGIGFNDPKLFYNRNEIIQTDKEGAYWFGNILSPGEDMSLIFRANMPEPCNGDFDSGRIFFWGEAI